MYRRQRRKIKPFFWFFLSAILIAIIVLINPYQRYLNIIYPHYDELMKMGYRHEEIVFLKEGISEENYQRLLQYPYLIDAKDYLENPSYASLKDLGYTIEELAQIMSLSEATILKLINQEKINTEFIMHPFFVEDRFDRYLSYQTKNPNLEVELILRRVNTNYDWMRYNHIEMADLTQANLILVNKYYQLPKDYVPNLVTSYDGFLFEASASASLIEMCEKMEDLGLDFEISNSYRSYDTQARIYANYLQKDPQNVVDSFSARAGHSEHQLGLALDFKSKGEDIVYFESTDAYEWLKENAHIYGFIQRYTEENSIYTGYNEEAWHYRYVGIDMATKLKETQLTLEEALLLNYQ
jgi:zinc D-Ala-D-Ala carboxypeptidase